MFWQRSFWTTSFLLDNSAYFFFSKSIWLSVSPHAADLKNEKKVYFYWAPYASGAAMQAKSDEVVGSSKEVENAMKSPAI